MKPLRGGNEDLEPFHRIGSRHDTNQKFALLDAPLSPQAFAPRRVRVVTVHVDPVGHVSDLFDRKSAHSKLAAPGL